MFGKKLVAPPPDKLMAELTRRGPNKVDRGDLRIVGMSGQIFGPRTGNKLPAVALAHDWLASSPRYRDLVYHLASWGIVVALPDSQDGVFPSDIELATDLRAAVTVLRSVRLGNGAISVDPHRVGVAGHGFGAAAAVRAAADTVLLGRPPVEPRSLTALFPAPTTADLLPTAKTVTAQSLVLAAGGQLDSMTGNALALAESLGGDVVLRTIEDADNRGLLEKRGIKSLLGVNGADKATHRAVRAQLTGYLLHTLGGDDRYAAFSDSDKTMGEAVATSADDAEPAALDHLSQLLGAKPPKE
ncbi:alpha/beta hydrolase [Gordonia sp. HY002]|uniref:alpha/beta hydrolase n=1 Tax=Gordonia zhenghanii TaxID=2911516 RepID=UPI001EEFC49F|nr:alpha/beta hydrolase [Gordonia zhenghanii]MCF8570427.1 alpha/beta hydrolase [Gordonia zhenghanii]MCF8607508.1 alpha/beta hydrolase [Gordonia zhenghanii]